MKVIRQPWWNIYCLCTLLKDSRVLMIHFDNYHLSYRSLDCPLPAFPLEKMINWTGIASIVLFYILILAVGMWAARKNTGGGDQEVSERLY